jgi:hypothetical protein
MAEDLNQLRELIDNIENSEKTPELIEWMGEISGKEYGLVDSLILSFMENLNDIKFANSVLRCLQVLNIYVKQSTLPQMRENENFPKAISKYLTQTKIDNLEGDGFTLLVEIFQTSAFKDVATDDFINALFNSLEHIKEERVFLAIVNILVSISFNHDSLEANLVLKYCSQHPHSRYFAESVLILLNKGKLEFLTKCLKFISDVFAFDKTRDDFFYSNDLYTLLDIILREFINHDETETKLAYLNALHGLLRCKNYQKTKPRMSDIQDIFDEVTYTDGIDSKLLDKIEEIKASNLL